MRSVPSLSALLCGCEENGLPRSFQLSDLKCVGLGARRVYREQDRNIALTLYAPFMAASSTSRRNCARWYMPTLLRHFPRCVTGAVRLNGCRVDLEQRNRAGRVLDGGESPGFDAEKYGGGGTGCRWGTSRSF